MGFFEAIRSLFGSNNAAPETVIRQIMEGHRLANIADIKTVANAWKPTMTFGSYDEEIGDRVDYYLGNMQDDMAVEIQRVFKQSHNRMEQDQLNVRFVAWRTKKLSRVFKKPGQVSLIDSAGNKLPPDDPSMVALQDLIDESNWWYNCKDADRFTTLCQRCCVKVWWDERAQRLQFATWTPNQVCIVVNPEEYWSVDAAPAVGFIRPGAAGLASETMEVWANLPDGQALHFVTASTRDVQINAEDRNPFVDPATKAPMYPFVWLQEDAVTLLYHLANRDVLRTNRALNLQTTDAAYGQRFQGHGVLKLTCGEENRAKAPATIPIAPDDVMILPAGWDGEFISPQSMVEQNMNFNQMIMRNEAQVDGLDARALSNTDTQSPESGVALRVKNMDLTEYTEDKKSVYKPQFEELLRRACIVRDYYAPAAKKLKIGLYERGLKISLAFAPAEDPVDQAETIDNHTKMISLNVSTAVDLRMAIYGETKEAATAAIEENRKYNAQNRQPAPGAQNINDVLSGLRRPNLRGEPGKEKESPAPPGSISGSSAGVGAGSSSGNPPPPSGPMLRAG